jgi:hypothetical protein
MALFSVIRRYSFTCYYHSNYQYYFYCSTTVLPAMLPVIGLICSHMPLFNKNERVLLKLSYTLKLRFTAKLDCIAYIANSKGFIPILIKIYEYLETSKHFKGRISYHNQYLIDRGCIFM